MAFRSHLGLEPFYCLAGIDGAHEKGGVEGDIGRFRRNHMVLVPKVTSLAELNELVAAWDEQDDRRRIGARPRTVGEYFAVERPLLKPLPAEPFETGRIFTPHVDRYSQITVRMNKYSVPVRFVGRRLRVLLHASELVVFDGRREVARHERLPTLSGSADRLHDTAARESPAGPPATGRTGRPGQDARYAPGARHQPRVGPKHLRQNQLNNH